MISRLVWEEMALTPGAAVGITPGLAHFVWIWSVSAQVGAGGACRSSGGNGGSCQSAGSRQGGDHDDYR